MNFIEAKELKELGRKLDWYGDQEFFQRQLAEGFTEVAFGIGSWIETPNHPLYTARRIVALWAFYHLGNDPRRLFGFEIGMHGERVTILAHPKGVDPDSKYSSLNLDTFTRRFNPKGFNRYLERWQICVEPKYPLQEIVKYYERLVDFYNGRGGIDPSLQNTVTPLQLETLDGINS